MDSKSLIWILSLVGSYVGSLVPMLWGEDMFSVSSIITGALGGLLGIWIAYKISH
jgi:uncharacterized membrane protein YeaQ/YmgE (transglycosylase-associated protein family)